MGWFIMLGCRNNISEREGVCVCKRVCVDIFTLFFIIFHPTAFKSTTTNTNMKIVPAPPPPRSGSRRSGR